MFGFLWSSQIESCAMLKHWTQCCIKLVGESKGKHRHKKDFELSAQTPHKYKETLKTSMTENMVFQLKTLSEGFWSNTDLRALYIGCGRIQHNTYPMMDLQRALYSWNAPISLNTVRMYPFTSIQCIHKYSWYAPISNTVFGRHCMWQDIAALSYLSKWTPGCQLQTTQKVKPRPTTK